MINRKFAIIAVRWAALTIVFGVLAMIFGIISSLNNNILLAFAAPY